VRDAYKDYHFNLIKALASYIAIAIKNSQESLKLSKEIEERIATQNKLEILNERLSHMSYMDALTQIPNRRSFIEYFNRELSRAKRLSEEIALFIIDIDFFKEYNDNYGHVEGDKCLTLVAALLKKALKREIDFVARYGGDEFVAVMSHIDYDGAYQIAEEMIFNIKESNIEHKFSKIEDRITITIGGIVKVPEQYNTMEQIIHYADNALYNAKEKGRNQISFYNDIEK
jgi:diguanylate cyclase (GGDEF)-like protein